MSTHEFWDEEPSLFFVYLDAYKERLNENAWLFGLYTNIAVSTALGNAFRKKNDKPLEYPLEKLDLEGKKRIEKGKVREVATKHFNKQAKIKDFLKQKYNSM